MQDDQFIWIITPDKVLQFVSGDHIVRAEVDWNGDVVLHLSDQSSLTVQGIGRGEILKLLIRHSILATGEKPPEEGMQQVIDRIDQNLKSSPNGPGGPRF